jgi:predicted MFS family arabinose efflux permease
MIPAAYRRLLSDTQTRRLLTGLGVSALGDGMSMVTIAWLAVLIAPSGNPGVFVGIAVAAYTLPGVAGAVALGRVLRHRPVRALVLSDSWLRAGFLAAIAILWATRNLAPCVYVALLVGSSVMTAWGNAGAYTMLSQLSGPDGRLSANSLYSAQVSLAVIVGPSLAGLLLAPLGVGSLIALDAASFAFLGLQAWRTQLTTATASEPVGARAAESGFQLLRRLRLTSLIILTWLFFFFYGPVEDALPVYVAHGLRASAGMLGAYWTSFGVGALVAALITGTLQTGNLQRRTVLIVAGWGACLLPFTFAPAGVTLACFALGGLIYGPFIPLTYALLQSSSTSANLPTVLAARSAIIMVASPLGTAAGGPSVGAFGAAQTLTASGAATVLLAVATGVIWARKKPPTGEIVMAPTEAATPAPPCRRDTITQVSPR